MSHQKTLKGSTCHLRQGCPQQATRFSPRLSSHEKRVRRCILNQAEIEAQATLPASESLTSNLPEKYKRLVARECGASFRQVAVVQEVELIPPGHGEVLIRVTHAGINGGCETFRARGEHAFAANRELQNFPLGAEGAGVVAALGPGVGSGLRVGQLVAVNGAFAFAQFVTARPQLVSPVPVGVPVAAAAALVLSGVTACAALEATARLQAGEVVAVTAAAGGTGHLALQLAVAKGATVVAVVGGPAKAAVAAALGAHHVLDHRREDVAASLRRLFPRGVDVVFEGVGGALRDQLLACLTPGGRLLQVGYISEYPHTRGYGIAQDINPHSRSSSSGSTSSSNSGATAVPIEATSPGDGSDPASASASAGSSPSPSFSQRGAIPPTATAGVAAAAAVATSSDTPAATPSGAAEAGRGGGLPSSEELFWQGLNVDFNGRRVYGQIWPKDLKAILRCRRRVFDLARSGQLKVLTDTGHGRKGVEGVADAVDYMLRGEHVGKVVIEL